MSVCPWCKEQVSSSNEQCQHCGKNAGDHPSIASSGFADLGGGFDEFDDSSDLVIETSVQPFGTMGGGHIDFGEDDHDIAIAVDSPSNRAKVSKSASTGKSKAPQAPLPELPQAPPLVIDPVDVAVVADFGPAPQEFWLCPAYALRVFRRKRQLKLQLKQANLDMNEALEALDNRLAALGEKLLPRVANNPEFEALLAPIKNAEEQENGRKGALAESNAEYGARVSSIDSKIAEETAASEGVRKAFANARSQHESAQNDLGRAQSQLRRAEIELRAVHDAARSAAGPNAKLAPPEFAARIFAAQQAVDDRKGLVTPLQAQVDAARKAQRETEAKVTDSDRKIAMLRGERKKLEESFSREFGVRADGVSAAQKQLRDALVTLALHLSSPNRHLVSEEDTKEIQSTRDHQMQKSHDAEILARAVESADPKAFRIGVAVGGAGIAVGISLLAAIIIIFGNTAAN